MVAIVLVGLIGMVLHARTNLVVQGGVVGERLIRGAPLLAPLLFADIAAFGLLVLLDSDERAVSRRRSGSASLRAPY